LQAQLSSTRDELSSQTEQEKNNWSADARRFSTDVDSAKLGVMELKATIAPAKIRLDEIQLNIKMARAGAFIDPNVNKIQSHYQIEQLKVQVDTLTKEIEENEELLEQAGENLRQAEQRWEDFKKIQPQQRSIEIALQPLREEINVNQKEIEQLEALANQPDIIIESPFDGIVTSIAHKTGETVLEEQPILTIVEKTPTYIIAYISEEQYGLLQERMQVRIIKRSYPEQIANSFVERLIPSVQIVPERLWIDNRTPQWGQPVLIPIPPGLNLIPGEEVIIMSM
jgi:multidrug resistance efflux pump